MEIINEIPIKEPIVYNLKGKILFNKKTVSVDDIELPEYLSSKLIRKYGDIDLQDKIDNKILSLRGLKNDNGINWFGLVSEKFQPLDVKATKDILKKFSNGKIRYNPKTERFMANYKIAKSLILGIINSTKFLESQPFLGQAEPHLIHRPEGIRYVLQGNYKILYSVFEERIMILDVFDTRMNPSKME